jgi:integrase
MGVLIKQWKGAWWVFIYHNRHRVVKRIGVGEQGKKAAREAASKMQAKLALGEQSFLTRPESVLFADYAKTWLMRIKQTRKLSTHEDYSNMLTRDILPILGGLALHEVTREKVKAVGYACLRKGQSPKTVQNVIRCLSSLLSHAVEDGIIQVNVALKPGKFLPKVGKRRNINPFSREEVAAFLDAIKRYAPPFYPFFLCAVRTGMRLGELLALQWGDIEFNGRFIVVQRNYTRGEIVDTPKNGETRRVDMSRELTQTLKDLLTDRQLEASMNETEVSPWVFSSETGSLLDPDNVRHRAFYKVLSKAGLRRIRFHDLRHTYASLLLQQGESPVYVKEQMGHSSISVTVDLYGHLIPGGNRQAVDRLDEPVRMPLPQALNRTQAAPAFDGLGQYVPEVPDFIWCARQELNLRPAGSKPDALSN